MPWRSKDMWKAGITIAGMLLFLVLMVWSPVSAAGVYEGASGFAPPTTETVQATPTEDATVTELNKEELEQEIQQLKNQNATDFFVWFPGWLRTNAAILISTLVVVIGGLIGLFRWFGDRRSEREKRAEERFQAAVTGLGDEKEGARIGAAILLRTFLRPGYEQFYIQTFDLAVANLRLLRTSHRSEDSTTPYTPLPLQQALIVVFKEAFPLARGQNKRSPQFLDAARIQLDDAPLFETDLQMVWMPEASLRSADFRRADLSGANLRRADLGEAKLDQARLQRTALRNANLRGADLNRADLREANLRYADLNRADLREANLSGAKLSGANLENALSLTDTNLRGVKELTKEQLDACKVKGAIIDEDTLTNPSQSPVSPPDVDESRATSPQQGPEP